MGLPEWREGSCAGETQAAAVLAKALGLSWVFVTPGPVTLHPGLK